MSNENINYFPEFNDDCYAECEEHFTVIRRDLLLLEKYIQKDKIDKPLLDELFRSFHTLKGLTGMIGQRDAEKLSHILESFLRALTKNTLKLSEPMLNGFFDGVKMLENLIDALRNNKNLPDLGTIINQLNLIENKSAIEIDKPNKTVKKVVKKNEETLQDEATDLTNGVNSSNQQNQLFKIGFTPTPELFEKGVNVNWVRAILETNGKIIESTPKVIEAGKVAFEFVLNTSLELKELEAVIGNEVTIEIIDSSSEQELDVTVQDDRSPVSYQNSTFTLTNMVRVDLNRLDDLMKMIGDLVISRARLDDQLKNLEKDIPIQKLRQIQETAISFERQLRTMREGVMRVRLIPIGEIFERMQFVIRDMIKESKKQIKLQISGKDTEIDKIVVEKMLDPLLHLVRNSVSHGIEMPEERTEKGKPSEGQIILKAYTSGDSVVIELQDDGAGINKARILKKAVEMGLITPQESLTDAELLEIICSQGFSTQEVADMNSGRGVGMAVVKKTIQELGGILELDTESDMGTKFTIHLPLTLAILDALILTSGGQKFAMPQLNVAEVLMIETNTITKIENNELISYRNGVLPIVRLSEYFKLHDTSNGKSQILVIGTGQKAIGIMVDKVLSLREIVVRSLADPSIQVEGVSGATELGDGKAMLILDTSTLIKAISFKKNNNNSRMLKIKYEKNKNNTKNE